MKTIVLVACILVAAVVYADDEEVKKFHDNYAACAKILGVSPVSARADTLICELIKDGTILDSHGAIIADKALKKYEKLISDPENLQLAKNIFSKCVEEVTAKYGSEQSIEQTKKILQCAVVTVPFIDKM